MTTASATTQSPSTAPAGGQVLAVGPAAQQAARLLTARCRCETSTAESLIEAVLICQHWTGLILVDVTPEVDYLESALRSLRRTNPVARLVLLCEPVHEALCRRATGWGASDYEITPVDHAGMQRLAAHATLRPPPEIPAERPASPSPRDMRLSREPLDDLPSVPLLVQTELLEEILAGAVGGGVGEPGNRLDFARRATALLARRLESRGSLHFSPSTGNEDTPSPSASRAMRRTVHAAGQAPFGTLIWVPRAQPGGGSGGGTAGGGAEEAGVLAQAANWLGNMLALAQRHEQLRVMAITDELSGAYNRRFFISYMTKLLESSREKRSRVTLLLFDIDDFKRYNDAFGHGSGDAIIRELIKLLRACTRPKDLVARIGGDEFAVVYWDNEPPRQPNSEHPKEIIAATERFREAIKNHTWPETCNIQGSISISGGLASFPWDADTLDVLMAKADEALLQAKRAGKNVIVIRNKMDPGDATSEPRTADIAPRS